MSIQVKYLCALAVRQMDSFSKVVVHEFTWTIIGADLVSSCGASSGLQEIERPYQQFNDQGQLETRKQLLANCAVDLSISSELIKSKGL